MIKHIFLICLIASTSVSLEMPEPIMHTSEDTISFKFLIRKNISYYFKILARLDYSSMSSNFSSNIPNFTLPGVQGRNPHKREAHFPEVAFKPLSVKTKDGQIMILDQSRCKAYNLRNDANDNFKMIDTVLNKVFDMYPNMECSNQTVYKEYWVLICFKMLDRVDFKMDIQYEYTLVVIDSSKNAVEFIGKFQDYYYKNPFLYVNFLDKGESDNMLIVIMNKQAEEKQKSKFQVNSRFTVVHLAKVQSRYRIKNITIKDMEQLLFDKMTDSISIRNFFFINQHVVNISVRKKEADYSVKNMVFTCKVLMDLENFHRFDFFDCQKFMDKNILHFKSNKYNSISVNEDKDMFFCVQNKQNLSEKKCKKGKMNLEWEIEFLDVMKDVGMVIVKHEKRQYVFLYYFDREIFTWYNGTLKGSKVRVLISRGQNEDIFLILFDPKGFRLIDVSFSDKFSISVDQNESTETKIVYLEGHPVFKMDVIDWDGQSVVNYYENKWWPVVVNPKTGKYFERLGFRGNNILFFNSSLQNIFFFKQIQFNQIHYQKMVHDLALSSQKKVMQFASNNAKDMLFLFSNRARIGRFYFDLIQHQNSFLYVNEINFPEDIVIDIDKIKKIDIMPFRFIVFLKDPFRIFLINTRSLKIKELSMPQEVFDDDVIKCHLFVGTVSPD